MKVTDELLARICSQLIKFDQDIVEIVQFGSSVYAPEHARDLDLLVFTRKRKDYSLYVEAAARIYDELNVPCSVDVIPCEAGGKLDARFAALFRCVGASPKSRKSAETMHRLRN